VRDKKKREGLDLVDEWRMEGRRGSHKESHKGKGKELQTRKGFLLDTWRGCCYELGESEKNLNERRITSRKRGVQNIFAAGSGERIKAKGLLFLWGT